MTDVCIILGSKSDRPVLEKCIKTLHRLGMSYEARVCSAHRTPEILERIVKESDADVFITVAGLSAALPGAVAAMTTKPVIGVPVSGKVNLDSILSIVQMPPGIPVAAVGLDRGENAALLAASILSLYRDDVKKALDSYRAEMKEKVMNDDRELTAGDD